MPIPDFGGLGPDPTFNDLTNKINQLVQKFRNLLLNLDSLNVVSLTADNIDAGTLNAGVVTIRANLEGGAYIQIDSNNGMIINDGTKDTFHADINGLVTMIGALIQSSTGYPRVEINSGNNLIGAYKDALHSLNILNLAGPDVPAIRFWDQLAGKLAYLYFDVTVFGLLMSAQSDITIAADGNLNLQGSNINANGTPVNSTLTSLQSQIDSLQSQINTLNSNMATKGSSTGSSGGGNGGIPIGTQLAVNGGGFVTWAGISSHSHTQT